MIAPRSAMAARRGTKAASAIAGSLDQTGEARSRHYDRGHFASQRLAAVGVIDLRIDPPYEPQPVIEIFKLAARGEDIGDVVAERRTLLTRDHGVDPKHCERRPTSRNGGDI